MSFLSVCDAFLYLVNSCLDRNLIQYDVSQNGYLGSAIGHLPVLDML